MSGDQIAFLSAAGLIEAYRRRELSPVEVAEATLARIDRLNPRLNAYLAVDHEGALEAARRAERTWLQPGEKPLLCGVPMSIKDLIYTSWLPTTHGSLVFKDYRTPHSSPVVERVLAAGAVVVGKTNTPEFGLIDATHNRLMAEGRNPWNLDHTCGGSSGGAGAAAAAGLAPLHIGTDGAGSIRIPSFYNGCFGLKPTFGRIPHDGWKGAPRTSHQGPMTRTVRDAALIMQATSGPHQRDAKCIQTPPPDFIEALEPRPLAGTNVALGLRYAGVEVDPEIERAVLDAAALLRELGCELTEAEPPWFDGSLPEAISTAPEEYADAVRLKSDFDEHLDELTDYGRRTMEAGMSMFAWQYTALLRRRDAWAAAVHRWFREFDFLLAPVMGQTAPPIDRPRRLDQPAPWPGAFLPMFNIAGNPAASVPFGFHRNGLPLAVQIVGRWGDDAGVLRVSAAMEAARPWADRWPEMALEAPVAQQAPQTARR